MRSHEGRWARTIRIVHPATIQAFVDELSSIQKEAGVRESLKKGTKPLVEAYDHVGRKAGIAGEQVLDKAKKLPVVGKKLKGVGLADIMIAARKTLL